MIITTVRTIFLLVADESKGSKGTKAAPNGVSRWKSIIKTIAEQVSQVDSPFSNTYKTILFWFVEFVITFRQFS